MSSANWYLRWRESSFYCRASFNFLLPSWLLPSFYFLAFAVSSAIECFCCFTGVFPLYLVLRMFFLCRAAVPQSALGVRRVGVTARIPTLGVPTPLRGREGGFEQVCTLSCVCLSLYILLLSWYGSDFQRWPTTVKYPLCPPFLFRAMGKVYFVRTIYPSMGSIGLLVCFWLYTRWLYVFVFHLTSIA